MVIRWTIFGLFFLYFVPVGGQTYESGKTYYGSNQYIEYKAGHLPVIISAPHGGNLHPESIPDRSCTGCVYVKDAYTQELIRQMYDEIFQVFGCYPHVIINRLHRKKLDANRALGDAADGNKEAEEAWMDYHHFIQIAIDSVLRQYGRGLYIDLHGHGHSVQRLELGYLISKKDLQHDDEWLNQTRIIHKSSIRHLAGYNEEDLTFAELLRGALSLGQMYENGGYPAVPSRNQPAPSTSESYFSGGYNTRRYGSVKDGTIDGIQMECNRQGVRDTEEHRQDFAATTAKVLKDYLEMYYFKHGELGQYCSTLSANTPEKGFLPKISLSPNPVLDKCRISFIHTNPSPVNVTVMNSVGTILYEKETGQKQLNLNLNGYPGGLYAIIIQSGQNRIIKRFVKLGYQ